jgi:hypothetical protein
MHVIPRHHLVVVIEVGDVVDQRRRDPPRLPPVQVTRRLLQIAEVARKPQLLFVVDLWS